MKRLTERDTNGTAMAACCGENCKHNFCCENGGFAECGDMDDIIDRLAAIEDILGDGYDLDRLMALVEADRMIGQEVWAQEKYLKIFREKSSFIQRTTIQYVSLLKGGDILCHTKTCAFTLDEIGKTVFLTRAEAEDALRREK